MLWTRLGYIHPREGTMSADLQFLEEWIPERMDPGTVFVLENQANLGHRAEPLRSRHVLPPMRDIGTHYAPPTVRRRGDDLRRRPLLGRIPAGGREYLLPHGSVSAFHPGICTSLLRCARCAHRRRLSPWLFLCPPKRVRDGRSARRHLRSRRCHNPYRPCL